MRSTDLPELPGRAAHLVLPWQRLGRVLRQIRAIELDGYIARDARGPNSLEEVARLVEGRERKPFATAKTGVRAAASRSQAAETWMKLAASLSASADRADRELAVAIGRQVTWQTMRSPLRDQIRPVQAGSRDSGRQR